MILWSKLTLVLNVLSMWMTFFIMYKSPTIDAIQRELQNTNRLEKWTLKNGFTISKNKTVAMHFCPDKKCMDSVLKLDNDHIQFVK